MGFLPGWDSAEVTETIAHNLHISAAIVFDLPFVADGIALILIFEATLWLASLMRLRKSRC
jgi:hypothetical protein